MRVHCEYVFSLIAGPAGNGSLGSYCADNSPCTIANAVCQASKCECDTGFASRDEDFTCSEYQMSMTENTYSKLL